MTALALSQDVEPLIQSLETLRLTWRKLWEQTNRPQGFGVLDGRMGAIRARMSTAVEKMAQFAAGKREDIPELTEKNLPSAAIPTIPSSGPTPCGKSPPPARSTLLFKIFGFPYFFRRIQKYSPGFLRNRGILFYPFAVFKWESGESAMRR